MSREVELLSKNNKIVGSNDATSTEREREKMETKKFCNILTKLISLL